MSKKIVLILIVFLAFTQPNAEERDFFEELEIQSQSESRRNAVRVFSTIKETVSYSLNDRKGFKEGISQARSYVRLGMEAQPGPHLKYRLSGVYAEDLSHTYHSDLELADSYIDWGISDKVWLKSGRQTIAWGQSDFFQILDRANSRDMREFGLVGADELRIPVAATKLSYLGNRWGMDAVILHEVRVNKLASQGKEFDFFRDLRPALTEERTPSDTEWMMRLSANMAFGDASLIYANSFEDNPYVAHDPQKGNLYLNYLKTQTVGVSGNIVLDRAVLKAELAYNNQSSLRAKQGSISGPTVFKPTTNLMLGVEYAPNSDRFIMVEASNTYVNNHDESVGVSESQSAIISSLTQEFLRDELKLFVSWGHWFEEKSDLIRIGGEYALTDDIKLGIDYIDYRASDENALLEPFKDHDQIKTQLTINI